MSTRSCQMDLAFRPHASASSITSLKLGLGRFAALESGGTAPVEMAGLADSLLGRPGFLTAIPAWRR